MSKAAYIGVGGTARKIKAIYVGDKSGKTRRVTAGYVGVGGVARQFFALGMTVGELDVGQTVKMNVGGVPTEFLVVHQGRPSALYDASCDGSWLLMKKNFVSQTVWSQYDGSNEYYQSVFAGELSRRFIGQLDAGVQDIVIEAMIPLDERSTTRAKAFPLSSQEVGEEELGSGSAKLDYFLAGRSSEACERRVEAGGESWWLRTTLEKSSGATNARACAVNAGGIAFPTSTFDNNGFRPALILPRETRVNENGTVSV